MCKITIFFCIFALSFKIFLQMMKKTLFFLLLATAAIFATGQTTYTYLTRDTLALKMDVYQPQNPRSDKACILYLFGGGFFTGSRCDSATVRTCRLLSSRGFVVAAIDYRLYLRHAPQLPLLQSYKLFDTAISQATEDCAAAVAYLCRHAEELHIDPSHIVFTGSSAGAITVLQTDYSRANGLPVVSALPQEFRPAAVVAYSGGVFCRNSALRYATEPVPTCMFHGTCDRIVSYKRFRGSLSMSLFGAHRLAKVFKKNGYNYWVLRFEDRGHEIAAALPATIDEYCAFVDAALRGRRMRYDATCTDSAIRQSKWTHMTLFQLYGR